MSLDARRLPRLLLIADGFSSGREGMEAASVREWIRRLTEAGVRWVSLRDHAADPEAFARDAGIFAADLRRVRPEVVLSVHGRLDVARRLGAGLHAGRRGATVAEAVAAGLANPVGASAHDAAELRAATEAGADYVTLSPIFATRTHPEAVPLGIPALRAAVDAASVPVLALGGLTPARARDVRLGGAHGVAVLSGLLDASDPEAVLATFLKALG
ncbi:MAG: thiamine phosphate synthase [Bacteroidota bacterium]